MDVSGQTVQNSSYKITGIHTTEDIMFDMMTTVNIAVWYIFKMLREGLPWWRSG